MSIVVRFHPANVTKEMYDESLRAWNRPGSGPIRPDLKSTFSFESEGNLHASEIWSSREEFEAFGEKLMPILSDIGVEFSAEPEIFEVQHLVKR